jgi:hypothetical protein
MRMCVYVYTYVCILVSNLVLILPRELQQVNKIRANTRNLVVYAYNIDGWVEYF